MSRKGKLKPELPDGYFFLYHRIVDSDIVNSLPAVSQVIYIKALSKENRAKKKYNGLFTLTPADFKNSSISERDFRRKIKVLIDKGLIIKEEPGGLFRNANKYKLVPIRNIFLNNDNKHWGKDTI